MAASRPPFPIHVLKHRILITDKLDPEGGWREIPCPSRRAYGCGDSIQEAVQGLALYARLGDAPDLNSSLAIRMTEGVRRRFESELNPDYYRRCRDDKILSDVKAGAYVEMAEEQGVTAIVLSFSRPVHFYEKPLAYYLVYDSIHTSLSMFQIIPDPCGTRTLSCGGRTRIWRYEGAYEGVCTLRPIVPKRTDGSDYKLFLLGHEDRSSSSDNGVLWVSSLSASDGTGRPSRLRSMDFPPGEIHKPFKVDVAFSCQGKAFWGDLKQGLLYYDLHTSDFGFVKLPREYEVEVVHMEDGEEFTVPVTNTRTLGCVGDSVRFVSIDTRSHYTNAVVRIWELQLPLLPVEKLEGKRKRKRTDVQWKKVEKVPAKVLWELPSFKESGLPPAPFQYPILAADGALCFVLVDQNMCDHTLPDHFCIFDMRYKRLWHGLVHDYQISETVIMQPSSNFLRMKQCSSERSFVEDYPAAEFEAMEEDSE